MGLTTALTGGFSQDPTAGVKCWVYGDDLYVEYEGGKTGLEISDTADYLKAKLPGIENHVARSDSARPETISHVKRSGLPMIVGVEKWKGSVEDGIQHLRSYARNSHSPALPRRLLTRRISIQFKA